MIPILYQDEHIVVVHKPSGLLVHRSMIDRHETQFLMQIVRDQIGMHVFTVHRLDKPTSGLMVLALSKESAHKLSIQFEEKAVTKEYLAIVRGYVHDQIIDYPLKEEKDKIADSRAKKEQVYQDAQTELLQIARLELPYPVGPHQSARFSLVKLLPKTGRKHQLRRHMAHIRHPILGDTSHGDGKQNRAAREHLKINRLALLAKTLSFQHPEDDRSMRFSTDIDEDLKFAFTLFSDQKSSIFTEF